MARNLAVSVFTLLLNGSAWVSGLSLALFTLRRWVFLLAAVKKPRSKQVAADETANVLLLVPFRDEAAALPAVLASIEKLVFPSGTLTVVMVDDGSTDGGGRIAEEWAAMGSGRHVIVLENSAGKAAALNEALARFPQGDLVAIFDADERPQPDVLIKLVRPFAAGRVGAVNGFRAVSNPLASPIASHATLESLVHQLVTMQAKERLRLAPAVLGSNCIYRRRALEGVGGFLPGALLEDSDLTLKLARAGWRTHFVAEAVSCHRVPETLTGYWQQHRRWAAGFQAVTRQQAAANLRARHLPWCLRLELLAFSLGYLDRVAVLLAAGLVVIKTIASRRLPAYLFTVLLASLITPLFQVMFALYKIQAPAALWWRVVWLPFFLLFDISLSLVSLLRKAPPWKRRR